MRWKHFIALVLFWSFLDFRRHHRARSFSASDAVIFELREHAEKRRHESRKGKWRERPKYHHRQLKYRSTRPVAHRYLDQRKIRMRCIGVA